MASAAADSSRFYALLLLAALSFAAFTPSLSGDFLLNDAFRTVANPCASSPSCWPRFFYDRDSQTADRLEARESYRPVTSLSFGLTTVLGGANPFWHHLASNLLHALNVCLVFCLARRLLAQAPPSALRRTGRPFGAPAASAGAALLFCLHPAQAGSVACIGARSEELALSLCLIALLLRPPPSERATTRDNPVSDGEGGAAGGVGGGWRRIASLAAFMLALLSKETAVFLIPAAAAHDLVAGDPEETWRSRARRWAPYVAECAVYAAMRSWVLGRWAQRAPYGGALTHAGLAVHGVVRDLAVAVWPVRLRWCYSFRLGPGFAAESAAMALALGGLCWLAVWAVGRRRLEGLALVWVLAALFPVSNIVPITTLTANRFLYAPLVGLALLWGAVLVRLGRRAALAATAALSCILFIAVLEEQLAWQNGFVLDLESFAAAPEDPCACMHLGRHYYEWGMLDRAEALARRALAQRPSILEPSAWISLAEIRMKGGRFGDAEAMLRRALEIDPSRRGVHRLLGQCALALGDPPRARAEFGLESPPTAEARPGGPLPARAVGGGLRP